MRITAKKLRRYGFIAAGIGCGLLLIYGLFTPPYLPQEPMPDRSVQVEIPPLEPIEWRETLGHDEDRRQEKGVHREVWSLQVGELMTDLQLAGRLQSQLRQEGFTAYIRRYRDTDTPRYGVYVGPWLNLRRLEEQRAKITAGGVIKSPLKVVPYSVYAESPPAVRAEASGN